MKQQTEHTIRRRPPYSLTREDLIRDLQGDPALVALRTALIASSTSDSPSDFDSPVSDFRSPTI